MFLFNCGHANLDVKFNLSNHTHEPYRKRNDNPCYLNVNSNHPKHIIDHIPKMMSQRLSTLSSNEQIFEQNKSVYEKALKDSGYECSLKYQKTSDAKKRNRSRKAIYFNPPFSKSVKTNVIKLFLSLIDKHFPKSHRLHKCFNRKSYLLYINQHERKNRNT